ncbi:glycoside hydrolase family 5 protein [Zopfia rhizophila CBS 207.26]|uniref:Glycoside hydrolase family 5 protein n=1 Tax=Zopfia rhizophila CBS 207.26 TaxID=1314779 RepID=A0A6A6ELA6_9PEZI|nr:glycoside hydrolase family 5 protein [Zopfia rhizophila CBS 207.26]
MILGIVLLGAVDSTIARVTCEGTFTPICAKTFTIASNPGWNAGNRLDAHWESRLANLSLTILTITDVKKLGFNGIRLPVTWTYHMRSEPPWIIDPGWLQHVSDVVDMITSNGLYVIVNAHHDSLLSFDLDAPGANYTMYEEKSYALWYQAGEKLACKSNMLAFEPLRKPNGSTTDHAIELNKLPRIFLKAINNAGGFNSQRVVVLGSILDDRNNLKKWIELPGPNATNPCALTYHYNEPWAFVSNALGWTIWGYETDKLTIHSDIRSVRGKFKEVPLIIGEFGLDLKITETAARWKWYDHIEDLTATNIVIAASKGINNTLAESTEDLAALEQFSSAYVLYRIGQPIKDQSLPFIWKGNTLLSIRSSSGSDSVILSSGNDYTVDGNNITFKADFISTLFRQDSPSGIKANLMLQFSAGADFILQAVQWDTPQPAKTEITVMAENTRRGLYIPMEYKGLSNLATVKGQMINSTYLINE